MITKIEPRALPAQAENRLYLDYIAGIGSAADFFSHAPLDFGAVFEARRGYPYPRQEAVRVLVEYNSGLGAGSRTLVNINALCDPATFCVIAGQQAGFLGGPVYTAYKIITTIRLAAHLQETLGARFVPVFWLATEDHDFHEINHAYVTQRDGEVGRVKFDWEQAGHPVADLPVTASITRAYGDYFEKLLPGPFHSQAKALFAPQPGEDFCAWHARIWSSLFAEHGLVIVEPSTLHPLASGFFQRALEQSDEVRNRLDGVAHRLRADGYQPALTSPQAGRLYTFDTTGRRVRVEDPGTHLAQVAAHPERYSTDAALRPLFADAIFPIVASVLGPGEIAYQAMLRPLYDLFDLPQPLLFPRKSYTVVSAGQAGRIARYGTNVRAILTGQLEVDGTFRDLVPASERALFDRARRELAEALAPLQPYLEDIDPGLGKTWEQTLSSSMRNLAKLEERATRARMSRLGLSKRELRALRNSLLPRGRLQERVFSLPHFVNDYGGRFIDEILSAGELADFAHHVLTLEEGYAES